MGKEVSLVPPYMIWAAALPQGHGPTSTCIACRAWSGLTIHTDKTFQESHQEIPFTTWKNNTECKPHKIGFENLRAFFFMSSMLGCYSEHFVYLFCVHFTLHSSTHFRVQGNLFSFYLFFCLHSVRCGFSGVVGGVQCLCQQRPVQHSHHGMHMA